MDNMPSKSPPRPLVTGIAHVQVAISPGGEQSAREFYGDLLGLPEIRKPASLLDRGGCWFGCGAQEIHCGVEESIAPTRRHPALLSGDLAALRARIENAGITTTTDREIPGYDRFYATDPFGNRIEFLQPVDTIAKE
jgi:catechol 2,3-dioxygenase-like lactoylglutathione lyase family enzyme